MRVCAAYLRAGVGTRRRRPRCPPSCRSSAARAASSAGHSFIITEGNYNIKCLLIVNVCNQYCSHEKNVTSHFKIWLNFILVDNRAGSFYNNGSHLLIIVVF